MRKLVMAATLLFTLESGAQQPQQCVNPDTVNALVFLGSADRKVNVTRSLPASMTGFRAPAGLGLIGTGVRGNGITTVAYKTALPSDKAHATLLAALGAEGWVAEGAAGASSTFNVAGGPRNGTVCRSGERRYLMTAEVAGTTYASVNLMPQSPSHECNTPDPGMQIPLPGTRDAAPRFQFPAGTSIARGAGGGGGGGGGSSYVQTSESRVITTETQGRLVAYLADQIAAQGWQQESQWSGSRAAGSSWRKTGGDAPVQGTLEIVRVREGTYDVDFTTVLMR